jgi:hypothetical protein
MPARRWAAAAVKAGKGPTKDVFNAKTLQALAASRLAELLLMLTEAKPEVTRLRRLRLETLCDRITCHGQARDDGAMSLPLAILDLADAPGDAGLHRAKETLTLLHRAGQPCVFAVAPAFRGRAVARFGSGGSGAPRSWGWSPGPGLEVPSARTLYRRQHTDLNRLQALGDVAAEERALVRQPWLL